MAILVAGNRGGEKSVASEGRAVVCFGVKGNDSLGRWRGKAAGRGWARRVSSQVAVGRCCRGAENREGREVKD